MKAHEAQGGQAQASQGGTEKGQETDPTGTTVS